MAFISAQRAFDKVMENKEIKEEVDSQRKKIETALKMATGEIVDDNPVFRSVGFGAHIDFHMNIVLKNELEDAGYTVEEHTDVPEMNPVRRYTHITFDRPKAPKCSCGATADYYDNNGHPVCTDCDMD